MLLIPRYLNKSIQFLTASGVRSQRKLHQILDPTVGLGAGFSKSTKELSFISNRQRLKEGTFCASELAGIEARPARSGRAEYEINTYGCGAMEEHFLVKSLWSKRLNCAKRGCRIQQESRTRGAETLWRMSDRAWATGAPAPQ